MFVLPPQMVYTKDWVYFLFLRAFYLECSVINDVTTPTATKPQLDQR